MSMHSRLQRSLALSAVLAFAVPSFAPDALGAPTPAQQAEARSRFGKGLELFRDGDYQAALLEFKRAYELAPHYSVLYNIGQVYFQLQDYPNALHALERYMNEGGKSIDARRRKEVEVDIEKLRARVANLEITVNTPDAEITVDDIAIGKSPLGKPWMVSAGRHKVNAMKQGFNSVSKIVEIASGDSLKINLELTENKVAPPIVIPVDQGDSKKTDNQPQQPTIIPPVAPPPPPPRPIPWVGWAITGGLAAGAAVTGILALSSSSNLKSLRENPSQTFPDEPTKPITPDDLKSAQSETQTLALVTDILAGGALIAAGVSLYFTVAGGNTEVKTTPTTPAAGAKRLPKPEMRVGILPGGVSLAGSF